MKKLKNKRRILSVTAIVLAGIIILSAVLHSNVSVKASADMMPGIETIVNGNSMKVLELVSDYDQAQMGAYVAGQEPWIRLYQKDAVGEDGTVTNPGTYEKMNFTSLEDGLSKLSQTEREDFANGSSMIMGADGTEKRQFKDFKEVSSERIEDGVDTAPLFFQPYQEKFFFNDTDSADMWKRLDLEKNQKVSLHGSYQKVNDGVGDYTKGKQTYYPAVDQEEKNRADYIQNIYGFTYQDGGTGKPYLVGFTPVQKDEIIAGRDAAYAQGGYGYYENIYVPLNHADISESEGGTGAVQQATAIYRTLPKEETAGPGKESNFIQYTSDLRISQEVADALRAQGETIPGDCIVKNITVAMVQKIAGANAKAGDETVITDGCIIKESNGVYVYYTAKLDADGNQEVDIDGNPVFNQEDLLYVEGKQVVSEDAVSGDAYGGYYYKVNSVEFSCIKEEIGTGTGEYQYVFTGDYAAINPIGEDPYLPVNPGEGNFYASKAEYTLTPQKGDYQFVEDQAMEEISVEVKHIYYQGGYENHDWFKRNVLHLDPGDGTGKLPVSDPRAEQAKQLFDRFAVTVDTMTSNDLKEAALKLWEADPDKAEVMDESKYLQLLLADYQLVYANGTLTENQAVEIFKGAAKKTFPVILNSDTAVSTDPSMDTEYLNKLGQWLSASDIETVYAGLTANGSPITGQMISEKMNSTDNVFESKMHFVNKNVYFFSGLEEAGTGVGPALPSVDFANLYMNKSFSDKLLDTLDFEEITKYIEVENKLREIENAAKEEGEEIYDELDATISQARCMEYILNYQYKRTLEFKGEIQVLDLEPAKSSGGITTQEVLNWMGYEEEKYTIANYCCDCEGRTDGDKGATIDKIQDNNESTYWHTAYGGGPTHGQIDGAQHYFTVKLPENAGGVTGFTWLPRRNGNTGNPAVYDYRISISDTLEGTYEEITAGTWTSGIDLKKVDFDKAMQGKYLKFESLSGNASLASCSEFHLTYEGTPKVNITSMSTSTFAGKIGDVNTDYDLIYVGSDTSDTNYFTGKANGYPKYYDSVMDGLVYTHVGDAVKVGNQNLLGLLDTDYVPSPAKYRQYMYAYEFDKLRTGYQNGIYQITNPEQATVALPGGMNVTAPLGNIGILRKSGNDITPQKVTKLMDFVKSGYPVVTANDVYTQTKSVNDKVIDNASYVYQFLDEAKGYDNVLRKTDLSGGKSLGFYLNLPKPKIEFTQGGSPPIYDENDLTQSIDDNALNYSFQIKDEAVISNANASYDCRLFVDLNTDGNFARGEEIEDIIVSDENNRVLEQTDGKYHLSANTVYHVNRVLPSAYREILNWKLEIEHNENDYIRTSQTGISKLKMDVNDKVAINVLQIAPNKRDTASQAGCTWDLSLENQNGGLLTKVPGYDFNVIYKDADGYVSAYTNSYLEQFDMIIMGFSDFSSNIDNSKGAVDGILEFIRKGKSVLFAHDTTSGVNYDLGVTSLNTAGKNGLSGSIWNSRWGYNANTILRSAVGMDRYGITSEELNPILKQGSILNQEDNVDSNWSAVQNKANDMAFVAGSDQTQTYGETQGYTNFKIKERTEKSRQVTQVNRGVITDYPYHIPDTFAVAETHGQYYQLALEEDKNGDNESDVVVWYCLDGDYYHDSPNDVRNNYYIYSKGNVMYTGVGHSKVTNETEKKLFINAIVAAYHSAVRQPSVNFVEQNDFYSQNQNFVYYSANSLENTEGNVLKNDQDLYFKVSDSNLINSEIAGESGRDLKLNFYQKVEEGTEGALSWDEITENKNGSDGAKQYLPMTDQLEGNWENLEDSDAWKVKSGNVYKVRLDNLQNLLQTSEGYLDTCEIYVTVSGSVLSYGVETHLFNSDVITFRKQQLLDLD